MIVHPRTLAHTYNKICRRRHSDYDTDDSLGDYEVEEDDEEDDSGRRRRKPHSAAEARGGSEGKRGGGGGGSGGKASGGRRQGRGAGGGATARHLPGDGTFFVSCSCGTTYDDGALMME